MSPGTKQLAAVMSKGRLWAVQFDACLLEAFQLGGRAREQLVELVRRVHTAPERRCAARQQRLQHLRAALCGVSTVTIGRGCGYRAPRQQRLHQPRAALNSAQRRDKDNKAIQTILSISRHQQRDSELLQGSWTQCKTSRQPESPEHVLNTDCAAEQADKRQVLGKLSNFLNHLLPHADPEPYTGRSSQASRYVAAGQAPAAARRAWSGR